MYNIKDLNIGDMVNYTIDGKTDEREVASLKWIGGEKEISVHYGFSAITLKKEEINWERTYEINGWKEMGEEGEKRFKELRQLALKALDDGKFGKKSHVKFYDGLMEISVNGTHYSYNKKEVHGGFKFINGFYMKRFPIDTLEDLRKVKVGAKGFMMNEVEFEVVNDVDSYTDRNKIQILVGEERFHVPLDIIKGSCIEQRE